MGVRRLVRRDVERVWGRRDLPPPFADVRAAREPIGEIWFEDPGRDPDLLVKYLFTSERLSIQVHPGDEAARALGHARGKDEAWVVLAAEEDAVIGLGLTREVSKDALRAAALDGSIETLLDWRPVGAGDVYYSPAGTIHAIGPGLSLVEVQQNVDLTYRLYDYGRPRELHLEEAVAVADPRPFGRASEPRALAPGRELLAAGPAFVLERLSGPFDGPLDLPAGADLILIPLAGEAVVEGQTLEPGTAWTADRGAGLRAGSGWVALVAYPGGLTAGS